MKTKLVLVAAAALLCGTANAGSLEGFTGTLGAGYNYSDFSGTSLDTYDIGGSVNYLFDKSGISAQGGFGYTETQVEGGSFHTWIGNGGLFWRGTELALGMYGSYNRMSVGGYSGEYQTYGLLGEYYVSPVVTLRLRGGGMTAEASDTNGGYLGGGLSWYILPELALNLDVSHNSISSLHWTTVSTGVEYLPFAEIPVTLGLSYEYANWMAGSGRADSNGLMIRLTYHLGEGSSLVDLDRSGPFKLFNVNILPV